MIRPTAPIGRATLTWLVSTLDRREPAAANVAAGFPRFRPAGASARARGETEERCPAR